MTHMNQEVKGLWLGALRDGKRKQGYQKLKSPGDSFCCLGVLCDLYLETHGIAWGSRLLDGHTVVGIGWVLPLPVMRWAGLSFVDPYVVVDGKTVTLSYVNDTMDLSFNRIADLIEAQL